MKNLNAIEFRFISDFAVFILYSDISGLSDSEEKQILDFLDWVYSEHGAGHWDFYGQESDYNRCDITGTMGDCIAARYVVTGG